MNYIRKDYNEFRLRNDKQSEEVSIGRAVWTSIQELYDKGLFDIYANAEIFLKDYLFLTKLTKDIDPI